MKKTFALLLVLLLLLSALALPAAAEPVPIWLGVHATGVIPLYETPITVSGARLTFDLAEFPEDYYREKDAYLAYAGKVTTEYTFYNPTAETVTATLVFPFGRQPDYMGVYGEDGNYDTAADAEKYRITVDGEAVKTAVRYTDKADLQFDLERDFARLSDTYVTDDFLTPETTVTKYTYTVGGAHKEGQIDEEAYPSAYAAFSCASDGETRFLCGSAKMMSGNSLAARVKNGDVITVYAFGTPKEPTWTCYASTNFENKNIIDGTVALTATESMTFEEFVLAAWSAESGIWQVDWYNAVLNAFQSSAEQNFYFGISWDGIPTAEQHGKYLQRWYEYQITLAPGESVACAVEAPIYPMTNRYYEPHIYTYNYQFSSFSAWANVGTVEVAVSTPFYMTASVTEGFEKTENGYVLTLTDLPETDLTFTLSSSQTPTPNSAHTPASVLTLVAVAALGIALITVPVVLLVKGWGKKK